MTRTKKSQSQNFNNAVISRSQIGQSSGNLKQTYSSQVAETNKPMDPKDIIKLIEDIQHLLKNSDLPNDSKTKCDRHLQTFNEKVGEKNPDKKYAADTLQKVFHVLKEAGKTSAVALNLMDKMQPVITRIIPWLGEAKEFLIL